jgi:hypothetical protein
MKAIVASILAFGIIAASGIAIARSIHAQRAMPFAPPCMRQRARPVTAACLQGRPARVRAPHRRALAKLESRRSTSALTHGVVCHS